MKLTDREYQPGDERKINALYQQITGRKRSDIEYRWEWLETWAGQGAIYLLCDLDRDSEGDLLAQYSLIPTPMSLFGQPFLGAKTENCMAHSDIRGTGLYSAFEGRSFAKARERFQVFFTTAGGGATRAAGRVRKKLGYLPLDSWVSFYYTRSIGHAFAMSFRRLQKAMRVPGRVVQAVAWLVALFTTLLFRIRDFRPKRVEIEWVRDEDAPLDEIETLWLRNRDAYGVTVRRTEEYLRWRLTENPYKDYRFLLLYKEEELKGYLVYSVDQARTAHITDLFADGKNLRFFEALLLGLKWGLGAGGDYDGIVFHTIREQEFLGELFSRQKFFRVPISSVTEIRGGRVKEKSFFVFLDTSIQETFLGALDPRNWFVTDLFKEGR